MPDGDIFQRRLRGAGQGWQGIVRLLNYEPGRKDVDQKILKACASNLRALPPNFTANIVHLLLHSLKEDALQGNTSRKKDVFLDLCYALRLENGGNAFEISTIAKEAAQAYFLAYRGRPAKLSETEVINGFAEKLVSKLIDSRFSRVRDVLQATSGRDIGEQISWERQIIGRTMMPARRLMREYLKGQNHKFRAPASVGSLRKTTQEILGQQISVLN